jgi:hypothetical protein
VHDVNSLYKVSQIALQVGFGALGSKGQSLALEVVRSLARNHFALDVVVYHQTDWDLVGDPLRLAFSWICNIYYVANEMLKLLQICLDVDSKLYWVLGFYHDYSETVEVFKVLLNKIDAAKATKHVVDG